MVDAYVDGSYDKLTNTFSYGMVIIDDGHIHKFSERFADPKLADMRNVAGEIRASMMAMKYCLDHRILKLTIYYDYEGIKKWCTGEWKARKPATIAYKEYYDEASKSIAINFVYTKAHSGIKYNEMADQLAKHAITSKNPTPTPSVQKEKPALEAGVISACIATMRIRYDILDNAVTNLGIAKNNKPVTVFVNIESIFQILYRVAEESIVQDSFLPVIESMLIDVAAHYKNYFKQKTNDVKVVLYYTDPDSINFSQRDIYLNFRRVYIDRFYSSAKGASPLLILLKEQVMKSVELVCQFIPNVYFISMKNLDAAMIPLTLSDKTRDQLIISSDVYDMQYGLLPDFHMIYKTKKNKQTVLLYTLEQFIQYLGASNDDLELLSNLSMFRLLISASGNTPRSILNLHGIGPKSVMKFIRSGIDLGMFTKDTKNIELIIQSYPDFARDDALVNYALFDFPLFQLKMANGSKQKLQEKCIDRSDINALMNLNTTRYKERPIWLHGLL